VEPVYGDPFWLQQPLDFWQDITKVDPVNLRFIPRSFWDRKPISYWKQQIPMGYWKYLPWLLS
jgi:hypothetical protein